MNDEELDNAVDLNNLAGQEDKEVWKIYEAVDLELNKLM